MDAQQKRLFAHFEEIGVSVTTERHPPVFTVEEARRHTGHLPGGHCKNLFLKDKKGGFWLIVCLDHQPVKITAIQKALSAARLSFAKPAALRACLGVEPGSVTPFALINDTDRVVQTVLDAGMLNFELLNYHPLRNDATSTISPADLLTFIRSLRHEPIMLDFDRQRAVPAS